MYLSESEKHFMGLNINYVTLNYRYTRSAAHKIVQMEDSFHAQVKFVF